MECPALGVSAVCLEEVSSASEHAPHFRSCVERKAPCVLRGFAADWPFVQRGRFDLRTGDAFRTRLARHQCHVSFEPGSTLFHFEVPDGWVASQPGERDTGCDDASSTDGELQPTPRLVNPGRLMMQFGSFLDVCEGRRLRHSLGPPGRSDLHRHTYEEAGLGGAARPQRLVRVVNSMYDDEDSPGDRHPVPALDVPAALLESLALYCVEDAKQWPPDVLRELAPEDPAGRLIPGWQPQLRESRVWLAGGGPLGNADHVTAGFHWDHFQNLHVVLSGRKEVFLVAPMEAAALYATRFCRQAQWRLSAAGAKEATGGELGVEVELAAMHSEESSSDYAVVSLDEELEVNIARNPALGSSPPQVQRVLLEPGDTLYIPPGWWHSIRTWPSQPGERALPVAVSINFWYALESCAATIDYRSEFLALQVMSCQRALAGFPRDHIARLLLKLGMGSGKAEQAAETMADSNIPDAVQRGACRMEGAKGQSRSCQQPAGDPDVYEIVD